MLALRQTPDEAQGDVGKKRGFGLDMPSISTTHLRSILRNYDGKGIPYLPQNTFSQ